LLMNGINNYYLFITLLAIIFIQQANAVKNNFYKSMATVVFIGIIIQLGIALAIGAVAVKLVWGL